MPNNLTFGQALEALKQGKKVKRATWGGYWQICEIIVYPDNESSGEVVEGTIMAYLKEGGIAPAQPYQADLLAEDWQIIGD